MYVRLFHVYFRRFHMLAMENILLISIRVSSCSFLRNYEQFAAFRRKRLRRMYLEQFDTFDIQCNKIEDSFRPWLLY